MKEKPTTNNPSKYDVAFINPCIDRVIEAIASQQNGQKVLLVFQNQITRTDSFQITQTFPFCILNLLNSALKSRKLKKLFLLVPHLIHPQKIIYLKVGPLKTFIKIIDLFLKNQLNEKSSIINQKIPDKLSFLKIKKLRGIVFQEYKINVSRFFIGLLQYFEKTGGKILVKEQFYPNEISNIIQCSSENRIRLLTTIPSPSNFALAVQIKKNKYRFLDNNNFVQIDFINSESKNTSKTEILNDLKSIISAESQSTKEIEFSSLLSSKSISNILKIIKIPLPGSFENTQMKDNYELGLEKFDIAKQTGISYEEFKIMFHRYGSRIDEMIDEAYEKMNEIRDPHKIWNEVESNHQKKYEWKD